MPRRNEKAIRPVAPFQQFAEWLALNEHEFAGRKPAGMRAGVRQHGIEAWLRASKPLAEAGFE